MYIICENENNPSRTQTRILQIRTLVRYHCATVKIAPPLTELSQKLSQLIITRTGASSFSL